MNEGVTINPTKNPFYMGDVSELQVKGYKTKFFRIIEGDTNGDKARYEDFIASILPFNPKSNLELSPLGGINKSWNKDELLIYVEYVEYEEVTPDADTRKF